MSSILPNRTRIRGQIRSITPDEQLVHFSKLLILLEEGSAVEGEANLLDVSPGGDLSLDIADEVLQQHQLAQGARLSCMIRRSPNGYFIIPDSIETL